MNLIGLGVDLLSRLTSLAKGKIMADGSVETVFSGGVAGVTPMRGGGAIGGGIAAHGPGNGGAVGAAGRGVPNPPPAWMPIACREIGEREKPGAENNPRILVYHKATSLQASSDEVPWCSSFMNWVMQKAQVESTRSAAARSWATWGVGLDEPVYGAVVVLSRDGGGHVGFYLRTREDGKLVLLGGNQADSVCEAAFAPERVVAVRWPKG